MPYHGHIYRCKTQTSWVWGLPCKAMSNWIQLPTLPTTRMFPWSGDGILCFVLVIYIYIYIYIYISTHLLVCGNPALQETARFGTINEPQSCGCLHAHAVAAVMRVCRLQHPGRGGGRGSTRSTSSTHSTSTNGSTSTYGFLDGSRAGSAHGSAASGAGSLFVFSYDIYIYIYRGRVLQPVVICTCDLPSASAKEYGRAPILICYIHTPLPWCILRCLGAQVRLANVLACVPWMARYMNQDTLDHADDALLNGFGDGFAPHSSSRTLSFTEAGEQHV